MKRRPQRKPLGTVEVHVRDRFEVALTPALEEAIRKTGPLEPSLTTRDGTPLYAVSIIVAGGQRVATLSSVAPLDEKETCPNCGSLDFECTTIPFAAWCPDPNQRACECGAKWKLCGNDLPLVECSPTRLSLVTGGA